MSTLKVNNLNNVAGDTAVSLSGGSLVATDVKTTSINSGPITGFRNRIINGGMDIDQRNAGAAVTLNNALLYTVDRWLVAASGGSGTGTATAQRVADAPPGFAYSLRYTVTNAKSPAASDGFWIYQAIEGQNITDFAFGTASSKTITLSFWVKSSLTGTFSGNLRANNSTPTYRSYVFNYTINSANTWQYVTITAPGDVGQTTTNDNTAGFAITFDLGSGSSSQTSTLNSWQTGNFFKSTTSVNLISTLNATFQVTGVQLEVGTTATPFERRAIGQELILCQRYFYSTCSTGTNTVMINQKTTTSSAYGGAVPQFSYFPVQMRVNPTIAIYTNNARANPGNVLVNASSISSSIGSFVSPIAFVTWNASALPNVGDYYNYYYDANAEL
jgi:hypothetical protein